MKTFNLKFRFLVLIVLIFPLLTGPNVSAAPSVMKIAQVDVETTVSKGLDYLANQMNQDGGIRWFDESSSVAATLRVINALAAAGYPQDYLTSSSGNRPIDFLQEQGVAWVNQEETESPGFNVARAGQLLTAIAAANENPRDFGSNSVDLVYELNTYYDPKTAAYGQATSDNVIDQVWAMIGLSSNNIDIPVDAADWLISAEKDDGSWDDGFGSFLDTTPLALLALISSDLQKGYPQAFNLVSISWHKINNPTVAGSPSGTRAQMPTPRVLYYRLSLYLVKTPLMKIGKKQMATPPLHSWPFSKKMVFSALILAMLTQQRMPLLVYQEEISPHLDSSNPLLKRLIIYSLNK